MLVWLSSPDSDRLAVIANMLSFGTLLLALVAGIVALAAYSAATGLPNLRLRFNEPVSGPGEIFFETDGPDGSIAIPGDRNTVIIDIKNITTYTARTWQ